MIEFNAQTGGRYVYVDDVLNLQDLALVFSHIFDECDNFIISGCEVSGSSIGAGYVYLNGKIRHFSGASGITKWPQYLYESNTTESVNYASGHAKVGRNVYGVSVGSTVPTTADALTGKAPASLTVAQSGGTLMKDAFFGKYALVLNPSNLSQALNSSLKINGDLEVTGNVRSLKNRYRIVESLAAFDAYFNNGSLTLQTQYDSSNNVYKLAMENGVGFNAYVNGTSVAQIGEDGVALPGYVQASIGVLGSVGIESNDICNRTEATNTAGLNVNMVGYNGGLQYYRNTIIGNGKGKEIVSVNGQRQSVKIDGTVTVAPSSATEGIVVLADKAKDDTSIQKTITWRDSNQATMGNIGYANSTDAIFQIKNTLAGISIYGGSNSYVDLGPAIKENGQALSQKYVLSTNFNSTVSTLATKADTYDKSQSDARFSQLANGFNDYVTVGKIEKNTLCDQIGAATTDDLTKYAALSNCLSDMATNDAKKAAIRNNIGVYSKSEAQGKLKDTGWIKILEIGLYARQIGNIVYVQGVIRRTYTTGQTVFTLPNTIDPPTFEVGYCGDPWMIYRIYAGSRDCHVTWRGNCGNDAVGFTLTYMV